MSHAEFVSQVRDIPQHLSIPRLLQDQATRTPDAPAILAPGRSPLAYRRLYEHIDDVVQTLHTLGLGRNDRVALVLPNGPEMAVAFLAVAVGMTCIPLNPAYSTSEFNAYLADLRPKALIVQASIDSPARAVAQANGLPIVELSPILDSEAGLFRLTGEIHSSAVPRECAQPEDVGLVLHTAGTTSQPKIVPLTHTNICAQAHNTRVALGLVASDRCLNVLPLFHTYGPIGTILASLAAGASVVCTPGFEATSFFTWLVEFGPTWYPAVPTIHQAILAHAPLHHEILAGCSLRFIRSGAAALPPQVRAGLERVFNVPVVETYGMTETSVITCNPPPQRQRKAGSVGRAAGPEVAVMDESGALLPVGDIGEIVVRGAAVIGGYENDPRDNERAFRYGWFRTGDQGYLDAEGYLFITGRVKEIINRGGAIIAPQEVDDVLMEHPAVAQAVAFAVPHARLGEDIAAAVVLHPNAVTNASDLRQFATSRLAAFKVPQHVLIVDHIPKGPTGKLQRLGLAEKFGLTALDRERSPVSTGTAAPRTPAEEDLTELWSQVLGLDCVGVDDNFFQLGGDSILATQLISRVREVMHVEVSFRSFFETPTVAGMARSIGTAGEILSDVQVPPLQPVPRNGPLPLSFAQQRLWFLEQLEPSRAVYNLPLAWRFSGTLNIPVLEQSLNEIVRRHDILRTTFPSVDGRPVQVIAPELAVPLPVVDLRALSASEREVTVQSLAAEEARRPFDLATGPLVRASLLRESGEDHVLLLTLHHIIFDGWSAEIFWRELVTLYTAICAGCPPSLPALPLQYADFAVWQRQWLQDHMVDAQLAYWKQRLGDPLPILELPTDRPRPPVQTFQGARQSLDLPASLTTSLKALSQREGATLFMTLVAAFQALLCRYTGQTDVVVGTPIAGRTRLEIENLLGFFVNTLLLRTDLSGNPRFREILGRVRAVMLGAYDHQDLPFEKLVEALQPVRDLSRHPLVQVMIALQPPPLRVAELPGLTARPVVVDSGTAKFDLTLTLQDIEPGLLATVEYNTDLFDHATITRMLDHFHSLLEGIVADPEQRLADLPLLAAAERQQLLTAWHNTTADYPANTCLHALFEAQVERAPDAVAVVCGMQQLSYSALNRRANQLAHHLQTLGVGPEVGVGLCVERSPEMVIGLLGILKAGGAYVPLDPDVPAERLATMLTEAQVTVLVTQQQDMAALAPHVAQVVCLETAWEQMTPQSEANPVSDVTAKNLAYVMFTSGSTGTPKGVMVEHRQVVAFLRGLEDVAPGGQERIGTAVCPFGFDVSVWECFSMLGFGGTLHVIPADVVTAPEDFARYLVRQRVTSAYLPPALLPDVAEHLEQQQTPIALDRLLVGVEPIAQGTLQRFRSLSEHMRIVNGYGPTETTVCATLFPFQEATELDRRTPIGTGVHSYQVYLVDGGMQPVPIGIPGELLIGGAGLARGYINYPELTAERFIPHPFGAVPGARLYRTGDLARHLSDGNLEFLGRRDQQVKIRGHRIELEDIEAALRQHPAVQETVVLACDRGDRRDKRLVAYLVATQDTAPTPRTLRTFLQQKLPAYMIPSAFVVLEALPRTPSGKIDRRALPLPKATSSPSTGAFVAPRTPVERTLTSIWAEVLGLEQVGVHDNFFERGGDSIRGIQVVARANRAGLRLIPKYLFQHQTVAELAAVAGALPVIETEPGTVTGPVLGTSGPPGPFAEELLEVRGENIEAIYALSPMQQGILFHTLYALKPGTYCAQWSCTLHGDLDVPAFKRAWQRVVDRHPVLRTAFYWESPHEPLQVVYRQVELPWRQHDWQHMSAVEQERQVETFLAEERARSFELSKAPLMRLALLQLAQDAYRCVWSLHQLLLDGWSVPILLQEIFQCYEAFRAGRELHLEASRPYSDYIAWLQQQEQSQAEAFWRRTLKGFLAPTQLNVGQGHGSSVSWEEGFAEQHIRLSAPATAAMQELARQHHLSVNTLMQGAWAILLSRYSGQEDVVFGAPVAGRPPELAGIESMVGLFINTLPVRVRLGPDARLIPWLQELQRQQAEARQYDYSPLVQVQGWSDVPRGTPLFETLLVFENFPARTALQEWSGSLQVRQARFMSSPHYPLTALVVPGSELSLRIRYQGDCFDTATIIRMLGHLRTLMEGMVTDPTQQLADLPMLTLGERQQLQVEWKDTSAAYPQNMCIHQLFEAQVARTPDAVAVVFEDQAVTYQALNIRANQLAHRLRALGVGPEVLVGIYVERSLEMVVGVLGILKAGGAYVPIDTGYPQERLTSVLRDAQVAVLLTQQRLAARPTEHQTRVVYLDTGWECIARESDANPDNTATPDNLVYVIYTSGSTGKPKGVAVEHRQLCNYLYAVLERLTLPNSASFATVSTLAADLGNTMVFGSLCGGGCLHILSQERVADSDAMADYLQCHAVDCLKLVPSHLAALHTSSHPGKILPRRLLILGGEAARADWVGRLRRLGPDCAILNHYGPTEATVGVLTYRVAGNKPAPVIPTLPLGRPLANVQVYVLDRHLHPVPIGVQGELYIGGANLTRGYLHEPALTAERFFPNSFSNTPGARLYKTGDLARYLPDGNIEFLGRMDNQVKIRGYRIELGEIEATLERHPAVQQAVVLALEDTSGSRRLVAYYVPQHGHLPDIPELRRFLQSKLPDYMVPAAFAVLDALPLTPNGKIDRQALPSIAQARPPQLDACIAPRTPIEEILGGIWGSILGVESIGIHDNFFALGGHSLLALQVISRLRKTFQMEVPLRAVFDAPTMAGLAHYVERARQASPSAPAPVLRAVPREGAIPLTATQEHLWGLDRLLPGGPFSNMPYAVRLTGALNVSALEQSFNEIIKRHEILRTTFTTTAGQPEQVIAPTLYLTLPVEDLRTLPQAEREATAQGLVRAAALYPFDLENGPLLDVRLLQLGEQEHILLLTMHHIISDGWSREILLRELAMLYNALCQGKASPLPDLPIQYTDYTYWQRQWLHSEAGKTQLAYWSQQLHDPLPKLELPTDRPRTGELSLRMARQVFQLPEELCAALMRFSRQEGTTLFMTLVSAFTTLLHRYTGQEDIRVGTLVANRPHDETEGLIGLFANLVTLRTNLSGNPTLREVLRRVRMTTLEAHASQDLPFEYLARTLVRERHLDRLSLFQVMFTMQQALPELPQLAGLTCDVLRTQAIDATPCELVISLHRSRHGLEGVCLYKTALFEEVTITHMLRDFEELLAGLIAQPEQSVSTMTTWCHACN